MLSDQRQLSSFDLVFLARYRQFSLLDRRVVVRRVPGVLSFVVQRGRQRVVSRLFAAVARGGGCEVQARVGGFGRGAFVELLSSTLVPLHPWRGRRLEGGGRVGCGGLYVVLK